MDEIIAQRIRTIVESAMPNGMGTLSDHRLKAMLEQISQVAYNEGRHDALTSLLTTDEAAIRLNISARRIRALAKSRQVGWQVSRNTWIFIEDDIEKLRPGKPGRRVK